VLHRRPHGTHQSKSIADRLRVGTEASTTGLVDHRSPRRYGSGPMLLSQPTVLDTLDSSASWILPQGSVINVGKHEASRATRTWPSTSGKRLADKRGSALPAVRKALMARPNHIIADNSPRTRHRWRKVRLDDGPLVNDVPELSYATAPTGKRMPAQFQTQIRRGSRVPTVSGFGFRR
jgi:hypothetical protein